MSNLRAAIAARPASKRPLFASEKLGVAVSKTNAIVIVLIVLVLVMPTVLGASGALSWKSVLTSLPAAILSVLALLQKSPRDLFQQLISELPGGAQPPPPAAPPGSSNSPPEAAQ